MKDLLFKYATPLTTGLFVISLISGIALFFKIGGPLRGAHEWLSMVLILPFVLHLWRNWRPFVAYFRRAPMMLALALTVVMTVPFFVFSGGASAPPYVVLSRAVLKGTPTEIAPVLDMAPEDIVAKLTAAGYSAAAVDKTFEAIASESAKESFQMIGALAAVTEPAK